MKEFFTGELTNPIPWFGITHFLLLLGFGLSMYLLWYVSPKIRDGKYEKYFRYTLLILFIVFEWKIFENRMLNASIFRMPLCAVALYGLTYSVVFRNEKIFKIMYFYSFGAYLTFLFFDTPWGLDRWNGWTFFGAHALIAWLTVYGIRVLGYKIKRHDLINSLIFLALYSFITGYATYKYGGSDEMFFFTPPIAELSAVIDIHIVLYIALFSLTGLLCMLIMYVPTQLRTKKYTS